MKKPKESRSKKIDILVVDDDPAHAALLELRLKKSGFNVETISDPTEGFLRFQELEPPIVVTDLVMPQIDGIALMNLIKKSSPDTEVIILSGKGTIFRAVEAMKAGAFDFLEKSVPHEEIEACIRRCQNQMSTKEACNEHSGTMSQKAVKDMYHKIRESELKDQFASYNLTPREIDIVGQVIEGKADQEIADALFVSYHTVKKHVQNVFKKTDTKNRIDIIKRFKS
ncbi:MAG: response regulator transcription factor [Proteobacteria bacterium]|nr:response regulator transcription factor [Pseudomonadota bacterium]